MKKSDLKTGMWVETRKGNKYIYLEGCETKRHGVQHIFVNTDEEGFTLAEDYNTDLSSLICGTWDILKIYWDEECKVNGSSLIDCPPLYWERQEKTYLDDLLEKTYLDDLLEKFPNTQLRDDHTPARGVCLKAIYLKGNLECDNYSCSRDYDHGPCCWDQPLGSIGEEIER